jgi:hypothetical protein
MTEMPDFEYCCQVTCRIPSGIDCLEEGASFFLDSLMNWDAELQWMWTRRIPDEWPTIEHRVGRDGGDKELARQPLAESRPSM